VNASYKPGDHIRGDAEMNLIGGVGPHDAKMTRKPVREAIGALFATTGQTT